MSAVRLESSKRYGSHASSVTAWTSPISSTYTSTDHHWRQLSTFCGWTLTRLRVSTRRGGGTGGETQCACGPTDTWRGPRSSAIRRSAEKGPPYARKYLTWIFHASGSRSSVAERCKTSRLPSPTSTVRAKASFLHVASVGARANATNVRIRSRSAGVTRHRRPPVSPGHRGGAAPASAGGCVVRARVSTSRL
jgi:hypothetical protein